MAGIVIAGLLAFCPAAQAGMYLSSSHGNTTYGVDRTDAKLDGYSKGNCAHCHEQHMSIGGGEPAPAGGAPSSFALFSTNHVNQADNFCFTCHTDTSSVQDGGLVNRSYSYRAANWSADLVNDVKEAFSLASSHNLDDISTFISGKWGYGASSNPCTACHNPHAVQGDPANAGGSAKGIGTRGYPVSRPAQHASVATWQPWGDGAGERMSDYSATYQAPFRFGSSAAYEPDGSGVTNGSNMTDFVILCTDCHNTTGPAIWSTTLGRNLKQFDWAGEKHGKGAAANDPTVDFKTPYTDANAGQYALACTDCHEPHGSQNPFLIRRAVNKLSVTVPGSLGNWKGLCDTCHAAIPDKHHALGFGCAYACHYMEFVNPPGVFTTVYRECVVCHYHGSTEIFNGGTGLFESYNGGERVF